MATTWTDGTNTTLPPVLRDNTIRVAPVNSGRRHGIRRANETPLYA